MTIKIIRYMTYVTVDVDVGIDDYKNLSNVGGKKLPDCN